jgi:hypothetical protein
MVGAGGRSRARPAGTALPLPRVPTIKVTVPGGAVADGTAFRLTSLSPQGLPGLLPLGWAPVAAFDLRASAVVSDGLEVSVLFAEGAAPAGAVQLVRYDTTAHAWELLARDLAPRRQRAHGAVVPGRGLRARGGRRCERRRPRGGETLTGVEMVPVPTSATSTGRVNPSSVAPTGGIAKGSLEIQSPLGLPSGTVVQAEVRETYTLRETDAAGANKVASTEKRLQDVVLFRPQGGSGRQRAAPARGHRPGRGNPRLAVSHVRARGHRQGRGRARLPRRARGCAGDGRRQRARGPRSGRRSASASPRMLLARTRRSRSRCPPPCPPSCPPCRAWIRSPRSSSTSRARR